MSDTSTYVCLCDRFMQAQQAVKTAFRFTGNSRFFPFIAVLLMQKHPDGALPDRDALQNARRLIKESTGVFSNFRNDAVMMSLAVHLTAEEAPSERVEQVKAAYDALREHFFSGEYLALSAMYLTDMARPEAYAEIAARARRLYDRMKKEHPFLTSQEDVTMAVLLALSPEADDEVIVEVTEACYQALRQNYSSGNYLQAVSHVLALAATADHVAPTAPAENVYALEQAIRARGRRFDRNQLPILASLALQTAADPDAAAEELLEIDACLAGQEGYGFFGYGKQERLTHAALLLTLHRAPSTGDAARTDVAAQATALTSAMLMVAAAQAAMIASMSTMIAASAAANASH